MDTDNETLRPVVIHSSSGRLGSQLSSAADVGNALDAGLNAKPQRGLVIHFHGGLVSAPAGMEIAARLNPIYTGAGAFPMFFVWESGLIESVRNNLSEILQDPVFRELTKKTGEWVSKRLPGANATRGTGTAVNEYDFRKEFDEYFDDRRPEPPVSLTSATASPTKAAEPDEDDLAANIEAQFEDDPRFQEVLGGLAESSGRGVVQTKGSAGPAAPGIPVLVDQSALDELFGPPTPVKTKGVITWIKVAYFVARVVIKVVKRHNTSRDHGIYTTIVEEVLRAAYLAKVGTIIWTTMKQSTLDAFAKPDAVGSVLLNELATRRQQGREFSAITLVGHSTGAVYICNFIRAALQALPGSLFNVIFLAPACRCELFAETVQAAGSSLAGFRMFGMQDSLEIQDHLVPIIYPRSLLYLVSGLFEDAVDAPILGMERFLNASSIFTGTEFSGVVAARNWLTNGGRRMVWSDDLRPDGFTSIAHKHGDFDDDEKTLASVQFILQSGF